MKPPSDAQARLLAFIADHAAAGRTIEWHVEGTEYRPSRARLIYEEVDREQNVARLQSADEARCDHRVATLRACERHGWLSLLHERVMHLEPHCLLPTKRPEDAETVTLRQVDYTEDGVIALGLWRERKLHAPPEPLPELSDREREIVALSRRALELGYCLAAREPARKEARRLRKEGWFTNHGCWIANAASGLVPTDSAITTVLPEYADEPGSPYPGQRTYRVAGSDVQQVGL